MTNTRKRGSQRYVSAAIAAVCPSGTGPQLGRWHELELRDSTGSPP